jgi:hypothetical protein
VCIYSSSSSSSSYMARSHTGVALLCNRDASLESACGASLIVMHHCEIVSTCVALLCNRDASPESPCIAHCNCNALLRNHDASLEL